MYYFSAELYDDFCRRIEEIAAYYVVDVESLDELIHNVAFEYNHGTPVPSPKEDPIPQMVEMARSLRSMIWAPREHGRIYDTIMAFRGHSFATAEDYFADMMDALDHLVALLEDVPMNKGGKPRDIQEFMIVRKLCNFWKSLPETYPGERQLNERFEDGEPMSRGGAFVCDIIECMVAETRPFRKADWKLHTPDERATTVRKSLQTQIRNYIVENRTLKKRNNVSNSENN